MMKSLDDILNEIEENARVALFCYGQTFTGTRLAPLIEKDIPKLVKALRRAVEMLEQELCTQPANLSRKQKDLLSILSENTEEDKTK